ncbi:hypothetical protein LUZ61_007410 [Rhynchospora tenuis]|uniref:C2 NT-type domain-containing protein n=1 Tax=Rhynchospora tenuis TaxID=198213 RepID=A0AAD6EWL2_9POAL|nr:hypothetical protein LUZ61_007410 [Rhynchospora tenuis]
MLGLRTKTKRFTFSSAIHVNYIINIQEMKPWPPSKSLKNVRSVVLHWENGSRNSGSTHPASPLDGRVEFNESFMLQVAFSKDTAGNYTGTGFERNPLEFNLYEPKKEKSKKHLIGSGVIDLAEHGVLKEPLNLTVQIVNKKSKSSTIPLLSVKIQPLDTDGSGGTIAASLREKESVLEYETESEVEIINFTDDEADRESSHSSVANNEASSKEVNGGSDSENEHIESRPSTTMLEDQLTYGEILKEEIKPHDKEIYEIGGRNSISNAFKLRGIIKDAVQMEKQRNEIVPQHPVTVTSNPNMEAPSQTQSQVTPPIRPPRFSQTNRKMSFAFGMAGSTGTAGTGTNPRRLFGERAYSTLSSDVAKNLKLPPVKPPTEPIPNPSPATEEVKEVHMQDNPIPNPVLDDDAEVDNQSPHKPITITSKATRNAEKVRELEARVELLEGELRDAAAVEIGLYSIVPEHASSAHKMHTPARRLARLYLHALRNWTKERRAKAARSISSALVLVARSCGNDVPRLMYWLSNTAVLRVIISQTMKQSDIIALTSASGSGSVGEKSSNGSGSAPRKKSASLWESVYKKRGKLLFTEELEHWADPTTFLSALGKTESWIFSRILESVWWQTFTPHMQSAKRGTEGKKVSSNKRVYGKVTIVGDQQQANLSIDIWKKAFKDASEKLCPIRACGHECGCLPVLARLVMEQCVVRLDAAMFNAILRESEDDMPTDPMCDPITDPKVLPIPQGKSSFGAGVQLKNAIGSWSRWLTDLFGMDTDEPDDSNGIAGSVQFVPFRLLNALSDLLMLPKDMLLETSVRKEVCPTFSSSIIKRVLDGFVTDEFCPEPVSENVLLALESKDHLESGEVGVRQTPYNVGPVEYAPPSVALIESIIGDVQSMPTSRSGLSVVKKSNTSDDELEELNSPLNSVIDGSSARLTGVKKHYRTHAVRYQLLHDIWKDDE